MPRLANAEFKAGTDGKMPIRNKVSWNP